MFFAYDACKASKCDFLHDKNNLYKGPQSRSLRFANKPSKDTVAANVAVVQSAFATPTLSENKVSWLWDTAAGRHLFGAQALTPPMKHCLSHSQESVNFITGG